MNTESAAAPVRAKPKLLIISGISGSGKSVALNTLEDQGFYCVDNLPVGLMREFVQQTLRSGAFDRVAVGIDARNSPHDLQQLPLMLSELAAVDVDVMLIFLDSSDEILLKRYSETRRRHPLSMRGGSLHDAIAKERRLMQPVVALADSVIDSSELNVHQLRRRIVTELSLDAAGLSILFESFAFKKGVPLDADFVFDARSLPNPHWDARLRPLSGKDQPVKEWLSAQSEVSEFFDDVKRFLQRWLPAADSSERSYLTVAIGCTGGRHRSVYLVEALQQHFTQLRGDKGAVMSFHRELGQ
jgi:RNase adapter protein RapZ